MASRKLWIAITAEIMILCLHFFSDLSASETAKWLAMIAVGYKLTDSAQKFAK